MPELMPFRLTRQLAGALAPHEATAVLQRPMGAAMGALRGGAAILQVTSRTCQEVVHGGLVQRQGKRWRTAQEM